MKPSFITILPILLLPACAAIQPIEYPEFESNISINVSKDIVSKMTEIPAGDANIPNSQVFVAKQGGGFTKWAGLLGMAIDQLVQNLDHQVLTMKSRSISTS